jgi:DNA-binding GntR family transcriptional regulator
MKLLCRFIRHFLPFLRALHRALSVEAEDYTEFRHLDDQFLVALALGAGCGTARNAISDMKAHMDRVCNLQLRRPDAMLRLIEQHRLIMDSIDHRDPDAAEAAMSDHLKGILSVLPQIEANYPDLFERE